MQNMSLFDEVLTDELFVDEANNHERSMHASKKRTSVNTSSSKTQRDGVSDESGAVGHDEVAQQFWQMCLDELRHDVKESELNQWLKALKPVITKGDLVLFAINHVFIRRIEDFYYEKICAVVARLCDRSDNNISVRRVRLQVMPLTPRSADGTSTKKTKPKTPKKPTKIEEGQALDERFTFENFVKGKSNALAYNACQELIKNLGDNKLDKHDTHLYFIYGSSGLGKTHLMHAVAHRYEKAGFLTCYFGKDQFFKVVINALRGDGADALLKHICQADLLVVDDVHMINNKNGPKVSQFLMTLFGEFTKGDKRLILASDRPPSQMQDFDTRFLSRFEGGLSLAIEPPDIEMRMQILQKKADLLGMDLPKDCAIFMAQNMPPDVRRLEGALNQVRANALLVGGDITLSLVRHAIKDRIEARARAVTASNIRDLVAEYYGVSTKDLIGKKRARNIARPRQMAMALVRELTQDSFPEIGQAFGGRDHTTVMHACEKIAQLRQEELTIEQDYQALLATLEFA